MSRWPRLPASGPERDKLDRAAAAEVQRRVEMVGGTVRPEDRRHEPGRTDVQIVAGRRELLSLATEQGLKQAAAYDAINTMQAQPFMLTLADGTKATVPSSGEHWLKVERHAQAHDKQSAQRDKGKDPPAPGKLPRGRPRKQG